MTSKTRRGTEESVEARRTVADQTAKIVETGKTFKIEQRALDYLYMAGQAIEYRRAEVERWFTDVCPECGDAVQVDMDDHSAIELEDGTVVLLIGCEGAFILNPNAIGMSSPNWQDWTISYDLISSPNSTVEREWTFRVPYVVTRYQTVVVRADRVEQAESNMLAAMLRDGLNVQPGWELVSDSSAVQDWTMTKTDVPR